MKSREQKLSVSFVVLCYMYYKETSKNVGLYSLSIFNFVCLIFAILGDVYTTKGHITVRRLAHVSFLYLVSFFVLLCLYVIAWLMVCIIFEHVHFEADFTPTIQLHTL